jgi:arsenate reductase
MQRKDMIHIKIYHNPKCSNSRNTLALIREHGHEPAVVLYLDTPPTRPELQDIIQATGDSTRAMMRSKETIYGELGLDNLSLSEDALIDAMLAHPILMNRPIVVTPKGTRLCRPPELVLEILPER